MDNRQLKMKADQYRDLRKRAFDLYREIEAEGFSLFSGSTKLTAGTALDPLKWEFRKTEVVKL